MGTMEKHYARATGWKVIPPGPWVAVNEQEFAAIQKRCKSTKGAFIKEGIEMLTLGENTPISTYKDIHPELYAMVTAAASVV